MFFCRDFQFYMHHIHIHIHIHIASSSITTKIRVSQIIPICIDSLRIFNYYTQFEWTNYTDKSKNLICNHSKLNKVVNPYDNNSRRYHNPKNSKVHSSSSDQIKLKCDFQFPGIEGLIEQKLEFFLRNRTTKYQLNYKDE